MANKRPCKNNYKSSQFKAKTTYRPVDDEIVGRGAAALHIVGILVGHILGGEADLGVAGGEAVAHLVAGDDAEGVVGPGRHGHLEGGGGGWDNV